MKKLIVAVLLMIVSIVVYDEVNPSQIYLGMGKVVKKNQDGTWTMRMTERTSDPNELELHNAIKWIDGQPTRVVIIQSDALTYDVPFQVNAFFACGEINSVLGWPDLLLYDRQYPVDKGMTGFVKQVGSKPIPCGEQ